MVSNLKVDKIQSVAGTTTAMTINSDGVISQPTKPIFLVTKSADQSGIPDATLTQVTFDEITDGANGGRVINIGGLFANNRFTVTSTTTGYYWVYTNIFWQTSQAVTGENYTYWRKNGSDIQDIYYTNSLTTTLGVMRGNQIIHLGTAGDYIELFVYMDNASSGTTNLNQNTVINPRTNAGGWKIA